jgi:hypothetical protein
MLAIARLRLDSREALSFFEMKRQNEIKNSSEMGNWVGSGVSPSPSV